MSLESFCNEISPTSFDYFEAIVKAHAVSLVQMHRFPTLHPEMVEGSAEHIEYLEILRTFNTTWRQLVRALRSHVNSQLTITDEEKRTLIQAGRTFEVDL